MNNVHPIFKGILAGTFGSQSFISSAYEQEQKRRESLDSVASRDTVYRDIITQEVWDGKQWWRVTAERQGKRYIETGREAI